MKYAVISKEAESFEMPPVPKPRLLIAESLKDSPTPRLSDEVQHFEYDSSPSHESGDHIEDHPKITVETSGESKTGKQFILYVSISIHSLL